MKTQAHSPKRNRWAKAFPPTVKVNGACVAETRMLMSVFAGSEAREGGFCVFGQCRILN
jgi:hypothetical protein